MLGPLVFNLYVNDLAAQIAIESNNTKLIQYIFYKETIWLLMFSVICMIRFDFQLRYVMAGPPRWIVNS